MKRTMIAMLLCAGMANVWAQDWSTTGNTGLDPVTNFLGNTDDKPVNIRTEDIRRFRLNFDESYALGAFLGMTANGFSLLSPDVDLFFTNGGPGPFSLFHLADGTGDNAQSLGYRPWMRVGLTVTGNADQGYLGHKYTYEDPEDYESGEKEDFSDMVIQWSDNPGKWLKDRMRFIFTSSYDESTTGAGSLEGLEAMRLFPVDDENVNVGIGDWYAANVADPSIVEPEERLDIVDGRVRVRQLPTEYEMDTATKFVVVNEDGVLGWRPEPDDCKWTLLSGNDIATAYSSNPGCPQETNNVGIGTNSPTGKLTVVDTTPASNATSGVVVTSTSNAASGSTARGVVATVSGGLVTNYAIEGNANLATGQGNSSTRNVALRGIAEANAQAWANYGLEVMGNVASGASVAYNGGIYVQTNNPNSSSANRGVHCELYASGASAASTGTDTYVATTGSGAIPTGVLGRAIASGTNSSLTGVYGYAATDASATGSVLHGTRGYVTGTGAANYGAKGEAYGGTENYGVWGQVPTDTTNNWAGYFVGRVQITGTGYVSGGMLITSDAELKTNVEELSGASELISQLAPKTYDFRVAENPYLGLPEGQQIGLIAQELEQVLPQLVSTMVFPARRDSAGQAISERRETKAVNYIGLIPVLIAAAKEQQAVIAQLTERLGHMEQQVAVCCASPQGDGERLAPNGGAEGELLLPMDNRERLLRIAPNPFTERTTLYCTLERAGRMQLLANSADGRDLRVLSEAQREAGEYQYEWNTENLAPGVYYITLLLDGEPVVKRAVKVGR